MADRIRTAAQQFAGNEGWCSLELDAPGFDAAYEAMQAEIMDLVGGPRAVVQFDNSLRANALTARYGVSYGGRARSLEATLFAVVVSGMADAVAGFLSDEDALSEVARSLTARGIAHPTALVILVPLPISAPALARLKPGAICALNRGMATSSVAAVLSSGNDTVAAGASALSAVRDALGAGVHRPAEHGMASRTVTSRILVGMRILPVDGDGEVTDFFTGLYADVDDPAAEGAHEVWAEAMRRRFGANGVCLDGPSTFTEAAATCAANVVRDVLDALADDTGWPMVGTCEAVHLHVDEATVTACFVRNGRAYGPAKVSMAAASCDPAMFDDALRSALGVGGVLVYQPNLADMPASEGIVDESAGLSSPAAANDNMLPLAPAR